MIYSRCLWLFGFSLYFSKKKNNHVLFNRIYFFKRNTISKIFYRLFELFMSIRTCLVYFFKF